MRPAILYPGNGSIVPAGELRLVVDYPGDWRSLRVTLDDVAFTPRALGSDPEVSGSLLAAYAMAKKGHRLGVLPARFLRLAAEVLYPPADGAPHGHLPRPSSGASPVNRGWLVLVAALLVGVVVWVAWRGRQPGKTATAPAAEEPSSESAPAPRAPESAVGVANDGLPIMPAGPNDPIPDGPVHPHPITAEHARIYEENQLIGALNGAMDVKDVPAMRRLLEEYREQYPEDDQMLEGGYAAIADCLEHPGEASRAAAQRWADEHRGSTLRRFVTRHCFGP